MFNSNQHVFNYRKRVVILTTGFCSLSYESLFFLSESDLFSQKVKKTKKARSHNTEDMFADQLSTLKIGDYLIHKNHGVGKYLGMETISMSGQENDFIITPSALVHEVPPFKSDELRVTLVVNLQIK